MPAGEHQACQMDPTVRQRQVLGAFQGRACLSSRKGLLHPLRPRDLLWALRLPCPGPSLQALQLTLHSPLGVGQGCLTAARSAFLDADKQSSNKSVQAHAPRSHPHSRACVGQLRFGDMHECFQLLLAADIQHLSLYRPPLPRLSVLSGSCKGISQQQEFASQCCQTQLSCTWQSLLLSETDKKMFQIYQHGT